MNAADRLPREFFALDTEALDFELIVAVTVAAEDTPDDTALGQEVRALLAGYQARADQIMGGVL